MNYLLIDGNNLAVRNAFSNKDLRSSSDVHTGVHYGFFQSLMSLRQKFPGYQMLIAWDQRSKRRAIESEEGVKKGIIPEAYKANRKKDEIPQPLKDFHDQSNYLKKGIGTTGIPQINVNGYEADDVIASYVYNLKNDHDIVLVTSDKDYYQLLDKRVMMWDGMKQTMTTYDDFVQENGITPNQWIDVGALMGDDGDNIFGPPGWGEKTAMKEISQHGSWTKVVEIYNNEYKELRDKYPDLTDNEKDKFQDLLVAKSNKDRLIYPGIIMGMPYTGVLFALHNKLIKMPKTILMVLMFQERIELAYSLKKMDVIDGLPEIKNQDGCRDKLLEYFDFFEIVSLYDGVDILFQTKV